MCARALFWRRPHCAHRAGLALYPRNRWYLAIEEDKGGGDDIFAAELHELLRLAQSFGAYHVLHGGGHRKPWQAAGNCRVMWKKQTVGFTSSIHTII